MADILVELGEGKSVWYGSEWLPGCSPRMGTRVDPHTIPSDKILGCSSRGMKN